jgi:sugar/nucleoside kinase (ribokinase family)
MDANTVYIYGMTVLSTIHLLKGKFPASDGYQEIVRTYVMPGGEAANCAVVLRNLGVRVQLDGCHLGEKTEAAITQRLMARDIDWSRMTRLDGFAGWQDIVFCDGESRTVFGWFVENLFGGRRLWTIPSEEAIRQAACIALDPFFGAESTLVAESCVKHGKDYVTIDCKADTLIAQQARAIVCSQEFLDREYPGADYVRLLAEYKARCAGLVIFTFGERDILYASRDQAEHATFTPFRVHAIDTLGAGDTFRAGVVYGVLNKWSAAEIVRFAAACAGVTCTRFPSVEQAPTMEEIQALLSGHATG